MLLSFIGPVIATCMFAAQGDSISVQCLTKDKKVIPVYIHCGQFWTTNVKMPDLLVVNHGTETATISEVRVTGFAEKTKVATNWFSADIPVFVRQIDEKFKGKLGADVLGDVLDPHLAVLFGVMSFGNTKLSQTEAIGPGESGVMLLSQGLYFTYTGMARVDELRLEVSMKQETETFDIVCPIAFTPYQCKGDYIFPVRGDIRVFNLSMNLDFHRKGLSQEFAIDAISAEQHDTGKARERLTDYAIYHRPVLAASDGVVVDVGDKFPESKTSNPSAYSPEHFKALTKELEPKIGYLNCVAGNYIVIGHENGEFSFYGHLSEGTIRVKPGDRVKKGDMIAAVGNTGHSSEPHLHFHLMDGKDMLTANGLPVMFTDVPPSAINQFCSAANALCYSDCITLRLKN